MLSNANIEYNRTKIELLENEFLILNDKYSDLLSLTNDISINNNNNDIDISNIVYLDSDNLLDLYTEDNLIKGDVILSKTNIEYNRTKIEIIESQLDNFNENFSVQFNNLTEKYNDLHSKISHLID